MDLKRSWMFVPGHRQKMIDKALGLNADAIMNFVEEVETGMVHVNEPTVGGEAQLPFGGTKATGVGEREMAEEGLNFFTELKTVFINYSGKAERLMIR